MQGQKVKHLLVVLNHMLFVFASTVSTILDSVLSHFSLNQAALWTGDAAQNEKANVLMMVQSNAILKPVSKVLQVYQNYVFDVSHLISHLPDFR